LIKLEEDEKVVSVLPVKVFSEGRFVVSATAQGYIKKTELMAYENIRATGIIGLKLEDNDQLISCAISSGKSEIVMATKLGKAIRFNEEEIRPMGRSARGVTGIRFGDEPDNVIGLEVIDAQSTILTVCANGFGKRSPLDEYRTQTRGGKGIFTIKVTERNGDVVSILQVDDGDDLMLMSTGGKIVRFNVQELGVISRHTQGVKLINLDEGEAVIGVCKVAKFEGEDVG